MNDESVLQRHYRIGFNAGKIKGYQEGENKAWNEMLIAVYSWNKQVQQTETSIEFEMFIKDKLNKLKGVVVHE